MDVLQNFFDSSTIHGVNHIGTTRKFERLFWIFVISSGFIGSGVQINQSLNQWAQSPVSTTIETLPISEQTLPNITVCPPEDTFTDLNYKLAVAENITLDITEREELNKYAMGLLLDDHLHNILINESWIEEDNKYYNWYHGYSQIERVSYDYDKEQPYYALDTTVADINERELLQSQARREGVLTGSSIVRSFGVQKWDL